ncbi:MAG: cysteine hydrolase [Janthinobacterium lividum]
MVDTYGLDIPRTLEEVCDPRRLALLVYDMQAGILSQIADSARVTAQVTRVLDAARAAGVRVFFTRHLSLPPALMGRFQYRQAMAWQRVDNPAQVRPWFLRDTPGFALVPEIVPRPDEAIADKITMSAMEGTFLDIAWRDCGITAFAVVGVAMEVGIEPTARHAADLGYIPIIIADACGAGHQEAAQRALDGLRYSGDSLITDVETFCTLLGNEQ